MSVVLVNGVEVALSTVPLTSEVCASASRVPGEWRVGVCAGRAVSLLASQSNSNTASLLTALFYISDYTRTRFCASAPPAHAMTYHTCANAPWRAVQSGSHHTKQNSSPYASASAAEQSADFDAATALAALALYLSPIALKKTRPTCGEGRQGKRRTSRQAERRECMSSSLVSSRYAAKSWTGLAQSA